MSRNRMLIASAVVLAGFAGVHTMVSPAMAGPKMELTPPDKETVQLLVYMEPDKNGKVGKAEFMNFMEKEFERLDVNRDGAIDLKEFMQSRYYVHAGGRR